MRISFQNAQKHQNSSCSMHLDTPIGCQRKMVVLELNLNAVLMGYGFVVVVRSRK